MTSPMENLVLRDSQALAEAGAWIARLADEGVSGDDGLEFDAWLGAAPGTGGQQAAGQDQRERHGHGDGERLGQEGDAGRYGHGRVVVGEDHGP